MLVVKLGGRALDDGSDTLFAALAALARSVGGGVVLVHGGGAAVDRHFARIGVEPERRDGIRVTPPDQIDDVVGVLAGAVNKTLVGKLQRHGVAAVGVCLGDGGLARTVTDDGYAFDPGRVGRIAGGDPTLVEALLAAGFLPVICSIGLDDDGAPLNVNADDAAADLAALLGATGLVLLTDVPGVLDDDGVIIEQLTPADAEHRIAAGEVSGGMIPKVRGAVRAAVTASAPVTIAGWQDHDALTALAAGACVGTRIVGD